MTTTQTVSHAKPKTPKKAKPSAADQVAKMRQAVLAIEPQPAPVELVMMPVSLIDCAAQVRTLFDDASLAELAADVACRGVLQPVLLRPIEGGRYLVIAGERRLRACVLAQLPTIPAIVGQIDDETAEDMQLAENIQREDLTLKDTAAAVRKIYDRCGSVTETAAKVRKSKSWVSKHLSATCPNLNYQVQRLLEDGITEDLEIILALDKLYDADWSIGNELCNLVRTGDASRQSVRDALDELPERQAAREKRNAEIRAENAANNKKRIDAWNAKQQQDNAAESAAIEADPHRLLWKIENELKTVESRYPHNILQTLAAGSAEKLAQHLSCVHNRGIGAPYAVLLRMHCEHEHTASEMAAFMIGMAGEPFDVLHILRTAQDALKGEE